MLINNNLCVYSCDKDATRQLVDHGSPDASLPFDGGDWHGGLHPLSEEQGYFQNRCLQELQNTLQGMTVNLFLFLLLVGSVIFFMLSRPSNQRSREIRINF